MLRLASLSRVRNHEERIRAEKINEDVQQRREDGPGLDVWEQREEREQQRCLVEDAAIVRRDIVVI